MRRRYDRQGMLAIEPKAFFWMFDPPPDRQVQVVGDAAIVEIRGPLDHHAGWWCDSYDAIRERVRDACGAAAGTVVLKIDSPGGDVSGCFETARELRKICAAAGKTLLAYADGQACSGGYALACAAEKIVVPETGFVGSVGVINTRVDVTAYDAKEGFRFALTTSGARKGDGHPHKPITDGESAATQTIVDSLAEVFFDLVSEMRSMQPAQIAALEAGVFHGAAAVDAGLADRVMSFDELLEAINAGAFSARETETMTKKAETRSALEALVKAGGDDAAWAKRALKAMDGEEAKAEGDDQDDEKKSESEEEEPEAEAEGDEDEEPEAEGDGDDNEEAAAADEGAKGKVSAKTAAELAMLAPRVERLERENRAAAVNRFLATRPDLPKALVKTLKGKPLDDVKAIVAAIPKPKLPNPAAAAAVRGTPGATHGGAREARLPTDQKTAMDLRMGLVATKKATVHEGAVTRFGVTMPKGAE